MTRKFAGLSFVFGPTCLRRERKFPSDLFHRRPCIFSSLLSALNLSQRGQKSLLTKRWLEIFSHRSRSRVHFVRSRGTSIDGKSSFVTRAPHSFCFSFSPFLLFRPRHPSCFSLSALISPYLL